MRILCQPIYLAALLALGTASASELKLANPYMGIPRNNPFRLVSPPLLRPEVQPESPPNHRLRLAGISSVGGHTRALLEVQQRDTQNIVRPVLQEREGFADINILGIDPEAGAVMVRIGPKTEKLLISPAFEKDSPATSRSIQPVTYRK